jgi:hypothetical protein
VKSKNEPTETGGQKATEPALHAADVTRGPLARCRPAMKGAEQRFRGSSDY